MRYAIRWLIYSFFRLLVSLRYRVRVKGMENLRGLGRKQKVLILPNHPGYADPLLVLSRLGPPLDPRPLVFEGTYANPLMWLEAIDLLFARQAETQATLFVITHDPALASRCRRVLEMSDGRIVRDAAS